MGKVLTSFLKGANLFCINCLGRRGQQDLEHSIYGIKCTSSNCVYKLIFYGFVLSLQCAVQLVPEPELPSG